MAQKRKHKKTDQSELERAYQILVEAMQAHPEIEQPLWASACLTVFVFGYVNTDIPYASFCEDLDAVRAHYAKFWKK